MPSNGGGAAARAAGVVALGVFLSIVTLFWLVEVWWARPLQTEDAGDAYRLYLPNIIFSLGALARGEFPLWNPYEFTGMPMFATLEYGPLYPLTWLYALGPAHHMHIMSAWLHALLLGGFLFLYARKVLAVHPLAAAAGALTVALSGWVATRSMMWPDEYRAAAYIPLALLLVHGLVQKPTLWRGVALAAVLTLQFFAGEIEVTVRSGQVLGVYMLCVGAAAWRGGVDVKRLVKSAGLFVGAVVLCGGMAAVQLLPTLEASQWSGRTTGGLPFDVVNHNAAESLQALWFALLDGANGPEKFFLGCIPVLLAVQGAFVRRVEAGFFVVVVVITGGLFLGESSWIAKAYYHLPTGSWFRWPARWLPYFVIAVGALAALGMDRLMHRVQGGEAAERNPKFDPILWGLYLTVLALIYVRLPSTATSVSIITVILAVGLTVLLRLVKRADWARMALAASLIGGMAVATFVSYDMRPHTSPANLDLVGVPDELVDHMRANLAPGERVYVDYALADLRRVPKFGSLTRIPCINGFSPFMPRAYRDAVRDAMSPRLAHAFSPGSSSVAVGVWGGLSAEQGAVELLRTLGVKYVLIGRGQELLEEGPPLPDGLRGVKRDRTLRLLEVADVAPRAFVVDDGFATTASEAKALVARGGHAVPITDYSAHRVALDVTGAPAGLLVLTDQYYPGWRVRVDGQEEEVISIADTFRGVRLDGETSTVEFHYAPGSVRVGAMVSLVAALVACVLLWVDRRFARERA
jgi:hypothetical protein